MRHIVSTHHQRKKLHCIMQNCDYQSSWNATNIIKHISRVHAGTIRQEEVRECYQPTYNLSQPATEISPEEMDSGDEVLVQESHGSGEDAEERSVEMEEIQLENTEGNLL